MKKTLFLLTLFPILLFSISSEAKIIKLIFNSVFPIDLVVYTNEKEKLVILEEAEIDFTSKCEDATLFYSSENKIVCEDKPFFTSKYKTLKENKNAIGAFYWKKGRPNIIFVKSRLEYFELQLPQKFKKYEVAEL